MGTGPAVQYHVPTDAQDEGAVNEQERSGAGAGSPGIGEVWLRRWAERAGTWLSDEALTGLLIILIVDLLVLPVFGLRLGRIAIDVVFTVLLVTGLAAVSSRRIAFAIVGLLVFSTVILRWMAPTFLPGAPIAAVSTSLATIGLFAILVFARTMSPGPITRHRIQGAVATYLLIGMAFSLAFQIVELLSPGSIRFGEGEPEVLEQAIGYFSLVTLTTVGYGDVTPVSPLARSLAIAEGLIGQLFPAIIIGGMISSMTTRRQH